MQIAAQFRQNGRILVRMDTTGVLAIVLGVVGVLVGALAVVVAWLWIARTQAAHEAQQHASTALALTSQVDALTAQLQQVSTERDEVRRQFEEFVQFLVGAGVLRPNANPLTVSPADLTYTTQAPAVDLLPEVDGIDTATLRAALTHAASRPGARAARPFSRRWMIAPAGPLSRSQYDKLLRALVQFGYLAENPSTAAADLTPSGRRLLDLARDGDL